MLELLPNLLALSVASGGTDAQELQEAATTSFTEASARMQNKLEESLAELEELQRRISGEQVPLHERLGDLERELGAVRAEYQETTRLLDRSALDLSVLQNDVDSLRENSSYLSNLFTDYARRFESQLHIAELHLYEAPLHAARAATEDSDLEQREVYALQAELVSASLERLFDALGGTIFSGSAVVGGRVEEGNFVLLGPAALFCATRAAAVGTAEQRLGSLEPNLFAFSDPLDRAAAGELAVNGQGLFPLDPSLGNAHQLESTRLGLLDEFQKGGVVMYAILVLAAAALLVALAKWVGMSLVRLPSRSKVAALLQVVEQGDEVEARQHAGRIRGPVGRMLASGVEHMRESSELVEEVMFEAILTTRLRLERFLPFVAIAAASAPLLGLLGTVTGIIKTFQLITVYGSGDVKSLSSGISEALITTKYGLIVAIPSLLIHAFLSRKSRRVTGRMEAEALAFSHAVARAPAGPTLQPHAPSRRPLDAPLAVDSEHLRVQVSEILTELLGPLVHESARAGHGGSASPSG